MKAAYNRLNIWIEWFLVAIFALLVVDVLIQVGSRFIFGQSFSFTEELARFALIWLSVLGAAYLTGKNEHLYMDFVFAKLNVKNKIKFTKITQILIGLFALVVLVIGGANLSFITWSLGQCSPALGMPIAYVYMIVPFSGLLIMFYALFNFLNAKELLITTSSQNQKI